MVSLTFAGEWPNELRLAAEQVWGAVLQELAGNLPAGIVNIKLIDDAEIRALNARYNENPYATDVLTFRYAEAGDSATSELADIVISYQTAQRQALRAGTSLVDEVGLLVLHGLLHTFGHDHQRKPDRDRVDELQRQLLASAGLKYREFAWEE